MASTEFPSAFNDFNFYENAKLMSPKFHYYLNLYDNDINNFFYASNKLYDKLNDLKTLYCKKSQLQDEICEEIEILASHYSQPNESSYVSHLSKFNSILTNINCYEAIFSEQLKDMMDSIKIVYDQTYSDYKDSMKKFKRATYEFKSSWSILSELPNVANIKDKSSFQKACVKCLVNKKAYQESCIKHVYQLDNVFYNYKFSVFKNICSFVLSFHGYLNNSLLTIKASQNELDEIYDENNSRKLFIDNKLRELKNISAGVISDVTKEILSINQKYDLIDASKITASNKSGHVLNKLSRMVSNIPKDFMNRKNYEKANKNLPNDASIDEFLNNSDMVDYDTCLAELNGNDFNVSKSDSKYTPSFELYRSAKSRIPFKPYGLLRLPANAATSELGEALGNNSISKEHTPISSISSDCHFQKPKKTVLKSGYLRLRIKTPFKYEFKPLFFSLNRDEGILYAQGFIDKYPRIFAQLSVSSVKPCRPSEIDRNFCFKLTMPSNDYLLQAIHSNELESWIESLNESISLSLSRLKIDPSQTSSIGKHSRYNTANYRAINHIAENVENTVDIGCITSVPGNEVCADCGELDPDWASINLGITICIKCSGIHRSLGVHISKVRSLVLDHWTSDLIDFMLANGNCKVNSIYEANLNETIKPNPQTSYDELKNFIEEKYIKKKFFA